MRTYIDAPDGGYWGLNSRAFETWTAYCDSAGIELQLTGISDAGELYYRMLRPDA